LRQGTVAVVVAANLLRHLKDPVAALREWQGLVGPTGQLWILEDEPALDGSPGSLYRDLQAFLSRVVPGRRALQPRSAFRDLVAADRRWRLGRLRNRQRPEDLPALIDWLSGHATAGDEQAGALAARLREEGLDYGEYWWGRWAREEAA
jgi:hypothetical protein